MYDDMVGLVRVGKEGGASLEDMIHPQRSLRSGKFWEDSD